MKSGLKTPLRTVAASLVLLALLGCHDGCSDGSSKKGVLIVLAPSGLTVTPLSSGSVALVWTDNSTNETGFRVERSSDGTTFTVVATLGQNATGHTDRGLLPFSAYLYRVIAFNGGVDSTPDGPVTAVTLGVSWNTLPAGPARVEHSAIYRSTGQEFIAFGGFDGGGFIWSNEVWVLNLTGTPAWNLLTPAGTPPSGRDNHTGIYDSLNDRMIVFGGFDSMTFGLSAEVWELTLSGTPTWTLLTPTGTPPTGRIGHSAVYDAPNQRMVVFGGNDGGGALNEVWELTLGGAPAWNQLAPTGTAPLLEEHTAVYDSPNERMLVFAGLDNIAAPRNDLYELTLPVGGGTPAWSMLSPGGPVPFARRGQCAVFDLTDERMVSFSGEEGTPPLNTEVWMLAPVMPATWGFPTPSGGPPTGRFGHAAAYDSGNHRMIIHGGDDGAFTTLADTWALSF